MKRILFFLLLISSFAKAQVGSNYLNLTYNPLFYGAIADSSTDAQPAFQRMVNAIAAGPKRGKVYIPAGVYKFNSAVVVPSTVRIDWGGAGSSYDTIINTNTTSPGAYYGVTKIVVNSTTIDAFRDSSNGARYHDFDIQNTSTTNPTAGSAINSLGGMFRASNMSIKTFYYGIVQHYSTNPVISNCSFRDCIKYDIYQENLGNPDIGDAAISNCQFACYFVRTVACLFNKGSGGLKVVNCKFNAGGQFINDCIRDSSVSLPNSSSDLTVVNCSLENFVGVGINISTISTGTFRHLSISGGNIASFNSGTTAIKLSNTGSGTLKNIQIGSISLTDCDNGIIATSVDDIHIGNLSNTCTTPMTLTSCTNVYYDRNTVTTTVDGLAPKELSTAFYSQTTVPTINAVVVQDDFNRANAGDINGSTPSPTSLGNWTNIFANVGPLTIVSNQVKAAVSGTAGYHLATGLANYDVSVVVPTATMTASGNIALIGSYSGTNTYLFLQITDVGAVNLYQQVATVYTPIYTGTTTLANGDTIHLRTSGGTAYAIKNSTLLGSGTYSIGSMPGTDCGILNTANTATVYDHFVVTSVTAVASKWAVTHDGTLVGDGTVASPLTFSGGSFAAYRAITAARGLDATDYMVNCTANSFTVTLPTAVGITGKKYIIKNTGTATTITIATTSSQTIDGSAPGTVTTLVPLRVMSDGANWITF